MGPKNVPCIWRVTLLGEMGFYSGLTGGADDVSLTISFSTQKTRLLLAYLLLHPKTAPSRERLASLFWPDSDSERARRSLRGAISALNKAFATAPDGSSIQTLWVPDTQHLKLAPGLFSTDIAKWNELRDRAERRGADQIMLLRQAAQLYCGPLMPGFYDVEEAEPWLEPLRTHYAERHRTVLWEVSRLSEAEGNLPHALEFARQAHDADHISDHGSPEARLLDRLQVQIAKAPLLTAAPTPIPAAPAASETLHALSPPKFPLPAPPVPAAEPPYLGSSAPPHKAQGSDRARRSLSPIAAATLAGGGVALAASGLIHQRDRDARSIPTPRPDDPGNLRGNPDVKGSNSFTASAAQGMEAADYEQALGHYQKKLALPTTFEERAFLADKIYVLGQSAHYRDKGQGGISLAAYAQSLTIYRQLRIPRRAAEVQLAIAEAVLLHGDRARAVRSVRDAQKTLSALLRDSPCAAELMHVGETLATLGEYKEARRTFEMCLLRGPTGPWAPKDTAQCLRYLGAIASDQGNYEEAEAKLTQAAALFAEAEDRQTRAEVIALLADCRLRRGDLRRPLPAYQEALTVWQECGQNFWIARSLARLARLHVYRRDFETARKGLKEAMTLLEDSNGPAGRALPFLISGRLCTQMSELALGLESLRRALDLCRSAGNPRTIAEVLESLAHAHLLNGNPREARSCLSEAATLRRQAGTPVPPIDRPLFDRLRQRLE